VVSSGPVDIGCLGSGRIGFGNTIPNLQIIRNGHG
jgi:hypothetical protein